MSDLATVTNIHSPRHSWDKQPRRGDPSRHVYTCRKAACRLMKRSEFVDGVWVEVWRWPDGVEGQDRKAPQCRAGQRVAVSAEPATEPAAVPLPLAANGGAMPGEPAAERTCRRCNPPCGRPARLHLGGYSCEPVVAAAGAATREWIRGLRSNGGAA